MSSTSKECKSIITSIALEPTLRQGANRLAERQDRSFVSVVRQALRRHLLLEQMTEVEDD